MTRLGAGELVRSDRTLGDLIERWLDHKRPDLAQTTWYRYNQRAALLLRHLGKVRLDKITPAILDEFYRSPGITPHAARGLAYTIVGPAFKQAHRWGWIASNPAKDAGPPTARTKEMRPPSHEDVLTFTKQLLLDDDAQWFGVFVHLLAVTGCRKGEVLGLRWDDIDWTAGTITVRRNVAITPATGVLVKEPKTARGRRTITVAPGTLAVLERWASTKGTLLRHLHGAAIPVGWIFPGDLRYGDLPLSPNILDRTFRTAKAKYGFPYRMHDIRHAVATTLLSGGVHLRAVADILGHARPEVTLGVYAHALPQDHRAAAALLSGTPE
jgi:integrase